MNPKHIQARIDQCLRNAELSRCPRRKFGAMLIDPTTNSIVADGYNGPPRGEEGLCRGWFCEREGVDPKRLEITNQGEGIRYHDAQGNLVRFQFKETLSEAFRRQRNRFENSFFQEKPLVSVEEVKALHDKLLHENPPIASGTHMEKGCHHAESNVLANAARRGSPTEGTWLIVTGEPCLMCAKLAHHAGVAKVYVVRGGYAGGDAGPEYLRANGVAVEYVEGPKDPRTRQGAVTPLMEKEWARLFPGLPTLAVSLEDETTIFHEGDGTEDDPPIMLYEHALHMAAVLAVTT